MQGNMIFKHEHDCCGIVTRPTTAEWLFKHPEAVGCAWIGRDTLINGIDALVDGSKIILDYGNTGSREVDPMFTVRVSKGAYEQIEAGA